MDKFPLVSIIIPVYNVESYIEQCIDSVILQNYQNIEIILVDDCGSDDSVEIANQILTHCGRKWKIVRHEKNRGLSAARNTGVDVSSGEFIFFLDSDDFITKDCIEKLYKSILETGADMAFGSYYWPSIEDDRNEACFNINPERLSLCTPLENFIKEYTYATAHNRLIRKDRYLETGVRFIEGILHEDDPWSFEMSLKMPKICGIADKTYCYQERESSIMSNSHLSLRRIQGRLHALSVFSQYVYHHEVMQCECFEHWYCRRFFAVVSYIAKSPEIPFMSKVDMQRKMFNSLYLPVDTMYELSFPISLLINFRKVLPDGVLFLFFNAIYKFKYSV